MIRLIKNSLIIPRGDTGHFTIPVIATSNNGIAVFSIIDPLTHTLVFQKEVQNENDFLNITFDHEETVNLPIGTFEWDIKYYVNPTYANGKIVDGQEINSYYAAFELPVCEIRQTGDSLLMSSDAPNTLLTPTQLNIISNTLAELTAAVQQSNTNVTHYPTIIEEYWYVWDATTETYVNTGVRAHPTMDDYVREDQLQAISVENLEQLLTL